MVHFFPDSTDHISTSTNSHLIDRNLNASGGNNKILLDKQNHKTYVDIYATGSQKNLS